MPEFPQLNDITERPAPFDIVPWILAVLGLLMAVTALAWAFYPNWRKRAQMPETPALTEPAAAALSELKALEQKDAAETSRKIQVILRTYLHRKYGALGLYRTADELLGPDTPESPPVNPKLAPFADVLRTAEQLRYGHTSGDREALLADAIAAIEQELLPATNGS